MLENNFIVRYPILDFQSGIDVINSVDNNNINAILPHHFDNVLLSVAPNLILMKGNESKVKKTKLKYMDRAATRTTPLGLLAGVMTGNFASKKDYSVNLNQKNIDITVDREWLDKILTQIEATINYDHLSINPSIYFFKDKIVNKWVTNDKKSKEHDIEITPPIREVIKILSEKEDVEKDSIIAHLTKRFGQPEEIVSNFINQLIREGIIVSDIFNLTLVKNPLDHLIKILMISKDNLVNNLAIKLINIKSLIKKMEEKDISILDYLKTVNLMKQLATSSHYLHIDLYNSDRINLSVNQKKKIIGIEEFLVATSTHPDSLKEFKEVFKDKYSINTLVNFKDLFNPRTGLNNLKVNHRDNDWLKRNLYNSIKKSNGILRLEKERWVKNLKDNINFSELENTDVELALIPFINNNKLVYSVSPLVGSVGKGNVEGRFDKLNLFNQNNNEYQLLFNPQMKRVANILRSVDIDKDKTIGFNTYPTETGISVKDIFILLDSKNRFHLFYNGNEIKTSYFSMVNQEVTPSNLTFLSVIGNEKNDIFQVIRLIEQYKEKNFVTPEIWYKDCLITGKSWNIEYFITKDTKREELKEYLLEKIRKIDKTVYWENGDNRILINLKSDFFINELIKTLKRKGYIRLERCYFTPENLLLTNGNSKYLGEIVFKFRKTVRNEPQKIEKINLANKYDICTSYNNSFLLNPTWTEFQIYLRSEDMNDFLTTIPALISDSHVPFFYIRYKSIDKGDHIRLRLQLSQRFQNKIFNIMNKLEKQYKEQKVRDLSINIYKREINRYGEFSIEKVEHIFCIESKLAIDLLKKYRNIPNKLWTVVFCHNVILLVKCAGLKESLNILSNFDDFQNHKFLNKEYREFKKEKLSWSLLNNDAFDDVVQILQDLKKSEEKEEFIETLLSIQHLFHNRILGINVKSETKMNYFIKKYLENIWHTER